MNTQNSILMVVAMTALVSCTHSGLRLTRKPVTVKPQKVVVVPAKPAKSAIKTASIVEPTQGPDQEPINLPAREVATDAATVETLQLASATPAVTTATPSTPRAKPRRLIDLAKILPKPRGKTKAKARIASGQVCDSSLTENIPARRKKAAPGSVVAKQAMNLGGPQRDQFVIDQMLQGNVPDFLRDLTPVTFTGKNRSGKRVEVTICVTRDYLAVGNDRDFVRMPMGLPAAAEVANNFGFVLPTTKMVDAIYTQAGVQLAPNPMQAGSRMSSTEYLMQHNQTVEGQVNAKTAETDMLVAGQKKDLVLSNVLRKTPGRVAIYGWHKTNGKPIQPLSTVHGKNYADYSHGIRLVSKTAYVNGKPRSVADLLENPQMAGIISKEGTIAKPLALMASISSKSQ